MFTVVVKKVLVLTDRLELAQNGHGALRYFMLVNLVKYSSVDDLVKRVKTGKVKSKEEVAAAGSFFLL